jgi:hypothetical protein
MATGELIKEGATKFDKGKPRYDLIPPYPMEALATLYGIGADKYGDRNWEKGTSWGRFFKALMSHAWKWWRGEIYDPEDGQHHLIAVMWNAATLYEYERRKIGEDTRTKNA